MLSRVSAAALIVALMLAFGGHSARGQTPVQYTAGWNLVAAPAGATLPADGPLYTLQPGDTTYESIASSDAMQPGQGYWAYFAADSQATLPDDSAQPYEIDAPAGVWFMIGNSGGVPARLSGADAAYTYDPANGYAPTDVLPPGRGAFVFSAAGGTITLTPVADAIRLVPLASAPPSLPPALPASTALTPAATPAASIQVLATGFGQSKAGGPVAIGMLLRNSGLAPLARIPVSITVYAADGSVIATDDATLRLLTVGETTGFARRLSVAGSAAAARVSVVAGEGRAAGDPLPGSLSFSQIALTPVRSGFEAAAVLSSSFADDQTEVPISALVFNAGGAIIGGGTTTRHLVPAGAAIGVLVSVELSGTPARVEFYAQ